MEGKLLTVGTQFAQQAIGVDGSSRFATEGFQSLQV